MSRGRWWGVRLAACCALAWLANAFFMSDAYGAYVDCRLCHLDPAPDSRAKDYFDYFVAPRRQHPTGIAYPAPENRDFIRPTALIADVTFFDSNGNGIADIDEVQLFGAAASVECSSCHYEHGDTAPPPQPNMYLRRSTGLLCMVCHRL